jgi:hypothetical protein
MNSVSTLYRIAVDVYIPVSRVMTELNRYLQNAEFSGYLSVWPPVELVLNTISAPLARDFTTKIRQLKQL